MAYAIPLEYAAKRPRPYCLYPLCAARAQALVYTSAHQPDGRYCRKHAVARVGELAREEGKTKGDER